MKQILSVAAIIGLTILLASATTFMDAPQDPPKKAKKQISMVRVENGKETKIDTLIAADQVFVWNGDTIGGAKELKWVSKDGEFNFDSTMTFDIDVKDMGNRQVFVVKSGDKSAPVVFKFKGEGDEDVNVTRWSSKDGNDVFFGPGGGHRTMFVPEAKKGNVIDLSDPGIISFEKKELKDGKEKIVIVREKPSEEEMNEEIIIRGGAPVYAKQIKVFADDDGQVKIFENGNLMHLEEMEEGTKVIEKDGKKIVIKKSKDGGEIKVNVEVEENKEEK